MQASAKRSGWEDPVDWIMSTCPWKDRSDFDRSVLQRLKPEDVGCDNTTVAAASVTSSGNSFMQPSFVEPSDPLVMTELLSVQL